MSEEKKEIESFNEDEKETEDKPKDSEKSEKEESQEEGFEKDSETVSANKYNQAIRKQRESELEKRELERQIAETKVKKTEKEEEKDDESDSFFEEDEKEKKEIPDPSKLIDEKLKPVTDALKKREENDRKNARTAFFEAHPEYLKDSEKWQGLLDEMDNSLNPNSKDEYYTQLEKTHRIISSDTESVDVENKKKEIAGDAASGGDGSEKGSINEEFTAEDRKHQKDFGVSDEGMRAYKAKIASGAMRLL